MSHDPTRDDGASGMWIPDPVRSKARVAGCIDWLDDLPSIIAELAADWGFTVGDPYPDGTEAFVCRVELLDGTPAVLKLLVPRNPELARREATVLRLAGGDGCPDLLEQDAARQAFLLERLGPSLFELALPIGERHRILCETAARVWRPAPDTDLPSGAWKARWLADQIARWWDDLDRPCSERVVEQALDCAARRGAAHDDERAVLVHGDVHQWNVLQATDGTFRLVDPDGLLAEPEYDLGIIMREDPLELMQGDPDARAQLLAAQSGLEVTAIREWGIVERVSTALLCLEMDFQPVADEMLAAAEHVAAWLP